MKILPTILLVTNLTTFVFANEDIESHLATNNKILKNQAAITPKQAAPCAENDKPKKNPNLCSPPFFKFDFDLAYFHPQKSIINDVYGSGLMYKAIAQYLFLDYFLVFASGDFFSLEGRSIGGNIKTILQVGSGTVGVGLNYSPSPYRYGVQLFGGPNVFYAEAITNSPYVKNHLGSVYVGADVLASAYLRFFKYFYANVFGEYSYKPAQFESYSFPPNVKVEHINVGGWAIGGGLGVIF